MRTGTAAIMLVAAVPVAAQPVQQPGVQFKARSAAVRPAACVAANDEVTSLRLGKDRQGNPTRIDVARAVEIGNANYTMCRSDGGFIIAFSIARIDLSANPKYSKPTIRTSLFKAALSDLDSLRISVNNGLSDRYEIFSILTLIYYDTRQYEKSIAVSRESDRFARQMLATSRQKVLITRGMAESQLGQSAAAAQSFDLASKAGHPQAAAIKRRMLGVK